MFIRASTQVYPRLHQITLGATCRYLVVAEDGSLTIIDPGSSIHFNALEDRLVQAGFSFDRLANILITHLDADRVGAIPLIRERSPSVKVFGNAAMVTALKKPETLKAIHTAELELSGLFASSAPVPSLHHCSTGLSIDVCLVDGQTLTIDDDVSIRCVSLPGHREHSQSFLVLPHSFLITDETLGYYRGRELAAPGSDFSLAQSLSSIRRLKDLELSGIGFPYGGSVTGNLARKHLDAIVLNTQDLLSEVARARSEGLSAAEVQSQVRDSFYLPSLADPCLVRSLQHSCEAVWNQLSSAAPEAPTN